MSLAREQYEDILRRLTALLPHAAAIDEELIKLVPEKPKGRRRNPDAEELFSALGRLSSSMIKNLQRAIGNIEYFAEQAAEEAKEEDEKQLASLEAEIEELEEQADVLLRKLDPLPKGVPLLDDDDDDDDGDGDETLEMIAPKLREAFENLDRIEKRSRQESPDPATHE